MARANPLWRAPHIHGELLKLGIEVSERTVSRILQTVKRPPSQTWKTFLKNHMGAIVAADFLAVPTFRMRVLFVLLVVEHARRKVVHFAVTEHPTAEWAGQQMVEAFANRDVPRYLIRDRDASYGHEFRRRIRSLGMNEVITAARSPWQNAFAERLIGSIRRDCLDHVVVLNRRHLTSLLKKYFVYYHRSRTHLALAKDAPEPRAVMKRGRIIAIPPDGWIAPPLRACRSVKAMATLNRSAVVVKPKQAFLDWLHAADPTSHELTLRDLVQSTDGSYLIPECDTGV